MIYSSFQVQLRLSDNQIAPNASPLLNPRLALADAAFRSSGEFFEQVLRCVMRNAGNKMLIFAACWFGAALAYFAWGNLTEALHWPILIPPFIGFILVLGYWPCAEVFFLLGLALLVAASIFERDK